MLCDSEVSELDSPCHSWLWETLPDTAPCLATQQGHLLPLAWAPFIVTEVEEAEDTEGSSGAPRATPGSRALPPTASARQSWGASGADPGAAPAQPARDKPPPGRCPRLWDWHPHVDIEEKHIPDYNPTD